MSSVFLEKFLKSLIGKGWTQKELSELIGVSQQHVSRLIKGSPPSIEIVLKLAKHFNVSTDEVLGRVEIKDTVKKKESNHQDRTGTTIIREIQ